MNQSKIVLFYVFTPLADPEAIRLWQQSLCSSLGLRGRIIVAPQGINATVGGEMGAVKRYVRGVRSYQPFASAHVKWTEGGADDFPKLSVRTRPELVAFGRPDAVEVSDDGIVGGGQHLRPTQLHELLDERDDVVFFDGRNSIESEIGHFDGAIRPQARTTRDITRLLDSGAYDDLKDKPIVTYCTGGVRCEVLSAMMIQRGFSQVYQLDGGIINYGKEFADSGYWRGSVYTFDARMSLQFSESTKTVSVCTRCGEKTAHIVNLPPPHDRELAVMCSKCAAHDGMS